MNFYQHVGMIYDMYRFFLVKKEEFCGCQDCLGFLSDNCHVLKIELITLKPWNKGLKK